MRQILGSSPGRALCSPVRLVSLVHARFRAYSGTTLFQQGEIVTDRSPGSSACLVWGSTLVRVLIGPCAFFSFVTFIP